MSVICMLWWSRMVNVAHIWCFLIKCDMKTVLSQKGPGMTHYIFSMECWKALYKAGNGSAFVLQNVYFVYQGLLSHWFHSSCSCITLHSYTRWKLGRQLSLHNSSSAKSILLCSFFYGFKFIPPCFLASCVFFLSWHEDLTYISHSINISMHFFHYVHFYIYFSKHNFLEYIFPCKRLSQYFSPIYKSMNISLHYEVYLNIWGSANLGKYHCFSSDKDSKLS